VKQNLNIAFMPIPIFMKLGKQGKVNNYRQFSCICVYVGSIDVLHSIATPGFRFITSAQI
jgi:hypothetical protein